MGMAGIPWFTTDMGGFHDGIIDSDDFKELLARWCAFSCFLPVMRNHGDRSLHTTTGKETITNSAGDHRSPSGADNEPWSYGPETEQIFRKFIAIREKMRLTLGNCSNQHIPMASLWSVDSSTSSLKTNRCLISPMNTCSALIS